jgi:hypothetical protein
LFAHREPPLPHKIAHIHLLHVVTPEQENKKARPKDRG